MGQGLWLADQPGSADVGVVVIEGAADGVSGSMGGVVTVVVTAVLASGGTGASDAGDSSVGKGSTGVAGSETTELVFSVNVTPSALNATIALPPMMAEKSLTRAGLLLFEFMLTTPFGSVVSSLRRRFAAPLCALG
ncbi:hypothetical protein BH09ACT8_BH09ACT8_23300 [soil metagenome]